MKKRFLKKLGLKIRQLRKEKGMSQDELAKAIGTVQQSIARIENGVVNTSIYSLKEICNVLETNLEDLLRDL